MLPNSFDQRAAQWDQLPRRVALAQAVVAAIISEAGPHRQMRLLDFGAGTGLVTLGLVPLVREAIAVDSSRGMLEQLEGKAREAGIVNLRTLLIDPERFDSLPSGIDLLVSSMTMHHVPDIPWLLLRFSSCMNPGALLCIADLEQEDGSFHDAAVNIPHHGFSREEMEGYFRAAGFGPVRTVPVMTVQKERDGLMRGYPVNLTTGLKPPGLD